jgi:hypothetical protein
MIPTAAAGTERNSPCFQSASPHRIALAGRRCRRGPAYPEPIKGKVILSEPQPQQQAEPERSIDEHTEGCGETMALALPLVIVQRQIVSRSGIESPCLEFSLEGGKKMLAIVLAEVARWYALAHANCVDPRWPVIIEQSADEASQGETWHA